MASMTVVRIGDGIYRVEDENHQEIVYVAGRPDDRWAFWNGHVFRQLAPPAATVQRKDGTGRVAQSLSAPMPATVIKVLATPGAAVRKGDTIVLLEAMKMELPVRAPADGVVAAVNCRVGDLVQPDQILVVLQ
jgi:biotin carboxyl carrier protein